MARPRKYEGDAKERKYQATQAWISKNLKQLNLKISPDLYKKLQEEAKKKRKSLRKFCVDKLSEGL